MSINWAQARCRWDAELFFPTNYKYANAAQIAEAKAICASCPLREACLAEALRQESDSDHSRRFGIRGGCTPPERYRLYRATVAGSLASAA